MCPILIFFKSKKNYDANICYNMKQATGFITFDFHPVRIDLDLLCSAPEISINGIKIKRILELNFSCENQKSPTSEKNIVFQNCMGEKMYDLKDPEIFFEKTNYIIVDIQEFGFRQICLTVYWY